MGLHIGFASFNDPDYSCPRRYETGSPAQPKNPDPSKFKVVSVVQKGDYTLVEAAFEGCTNYEGRKLLVFKGVSPKRLWALKEMDPHFRKGGPLARFEPSPEGTEAAMMFISMMAAWESEKETLKEYSEPKRPSRRKD